MRVIIDESKCSGCGDCVDVCPAEPCVFEIAEEKSRVVNEQECIDCGSCEDACPEEAIRLEDD